MWASRVNKPPFFCVWCNGVEQCVWRARANSWAWARTRKSGSGKIQPAVLCLPSWMNLKIGSSNNRTPFTWLLIRAKQTLSEHSVVDEWVWASASSFADQWSARVGRGVWPFLVILTAAQIWEDGCMWVNGWLEIAAVMKASRVFLLSSDWTLCLTAQHYIMDATTHRYITCINDKSGLSSRACGALVPKLQRYCVTAPSIGCYLHRQHHDTAENVAYCAMLCVFPCPELCILIIVGISWLVSVVKKQNK